MGELGQLQHMDWEAFVEAHFRPHLVVLHGQSAGGRRDGRSLVERLLAASHFAGNHARRSDGPELHVAFELADDARRFGHIVGVRSSVRAADWASRSTAWLTRSSRQRIAHYLEAGPNAADPQDRD
jgi:hypothetical protein